MRSNLIATVVAMLAVSLGWSLASRALACSCMLQVHGFLLSDSTEVPSNIGGIPCWVVEARIHDHRLVGYFPPPADSFRVEQLRAAEWIPVPFVMEHLEDSPVGSRPSSGPGFMCLLTPKGGFAAGGTYRFTCHGANPRFRQSVRIHVAAESLSVDSLRGTVHFGEPKRGSLKVRSLGGECTTTINAVQREIRFELPSGMRRFGDALLFAVRTDGDGLWQPTADLCDLVPPGLSWRGRGIDLLYADCSTPFIAGGRSEEPHLRPGTHEIEMVAWLPGTRILWTARADVELECR
jgi:hypothetical protein